MDLKLDDYSYTERSCMIGEQIVFLWELSFYFRSVRRFFSFSGQCPLPEICKAEAAKAYEGVIRGFWDAEINNQKVTE
jgi:hypothetical protein